MGEIIYNAMRDTINVPPHDKFQVITEHALEDINVAESYLDNHYSNDIILIQITLSAGRSVDLKKAFFKRIVDDVHAHLLQPNDMVINPDRGRQTPAFGQGIAHYALCEVHRWPVTEKDTESRPSNSANHQMFVAVHVSPSLPRKKSISSTKKEL